MEHLEYHPHAYLDSDNFVVSVLLFDSHDYDLINSFKDNFGAVDIKSCCEYGECGVGAYFYNGKFYMSKTKPSWVFDTNVLNWVPPLPVPDSGKWEWDEESLSWKESL